MPVMTQHNPIPVFKAGSEPDSNGQVRRFTSADLQDIAAAYDKTLHEAPFVLGHPKHDAPAWGWADSFSVEGDILYVIPSQVNPDFADRVNAGQFKKRSLSLYPPTHPNNPKPGTWYPRHVGWLGAMPPAKKGLPDFHFNDDAAGVVDLTAYEETTDMAKTQAAAQENTPPQDTAQDTPPTDYAERENVLLRQQMQLEQKQREFERQQEQFRQQQARFEAAQTAAYAEQLAEQGKILPREQELIVTLLTQADASDTFNFNEGETTVKGLLQTFLDGLESRVDYGEVATDYAEKKPKKVKPGEEEEPDDTEIAFNAKFLPKKKKGDKE